MASMMIISFAFVLLVATSLQMPLIPDDDDLPSFDDHEGVIPIDEALITIFEIRRIQPKEVETNREEKPDEAASGVKEEKGSNRVDDQVQSNTNRDKENEDKTAKDVENGGEISHDVVRRSAVGDDIVDNDLLAQNDFSFNKDSETGLLGHMKFLPAWMG